MADSNVNGPVKATTQTVPFGLFVGGTLAFITLPLILPFLCNHLLPPADAAVSKAFYFDNMGVALTWIVSGGAGGSIAGSLLSRGGKVVAQLTKGIKTPATPNGEGIGSDVETDVGSDTEDNDNPMPDDEPQADETAPVNPSVKPSPHSKVVLRGKPT